MKDNTEIIDWLRQERSLSELCQQFPEEWDAVQREMVQVISKRNPEMLESNNVSVDDDASPSKQEQNDLKHKRNGDITVSKYVRQRMLQLAIKNHYLSVATGVTDGKIRFNLLNGILVQKLLFAHDLERKPASLFWFRLLWPFIWQRNYLMPLVEPKGIYCFYSRELINALAKIIGSASCLEIAAGDGTLTRFLKARDVQITATDNQSWSHAIKFPNDVIHCDAEDALRRYQPTVVICSWPPANSHFEHQIFKTSSVQTYILIASRYEFASGNWSDYREQTTFSFEADKKLSRLVLPPELESAVYIFRRKHHQ